MKILTLNAGYFLGFDGTIRDYARNPLKTVIGSDIQASRTTEEFSRLIAEERPESILLQEIDRGSIRSSPKSLPGNIESQLPTGYRAFTETKYGGLTGRLPFAGKMANSIITRNGDVQNHFLESGTKNLVQELEVEGLSIFSVHLSRFGKKVRKSQIKEIREIAEGRDSYVVAGDFNFMKSSEHVEAEKILGKRFSPGPTFPAKKPSKALDMVFASEGLELSIEVVDRRFSDHRPLIFEVE